VDDPQPAVGCGDFVAVDVPDEDEDDELDESLDEDDEDDDSLEDDEDVEDAGAVSEDDCLPRLSLR
jgi:hypothetical protein